MYNHLLMQQGCFCPTVHQFIQTCFRSCRNKRYDNGNDFDAAPAKNIVYFGAVQAVVTAATNSTLTVKVPAGATFQPVTVTTNKLTAYADKPFRATFSGIDSLNANSFARVADISVNQNAKNYCRRRPER